MLLSIDRLDAGYHDLQVLWSVSLDLPHGRIAVVAGPNGAGKSTLLKAVAGTVRPTSGRVRIEGRDVTRWSHARRLRNGVAWVPEGRLLFDDLSVRENLRMSAYMAGIPKSGFADRLAKVIEVFPDLKDWLRRPAGQLSGGQQQIVAVARALIRGPRLILLDEPSVGLAPKVVARMGERLHAMREMGVGICVAEQNVAWLAGIADQVHVLTGGRITGGVDPALLRSRDFLREAYLSV
ncbi:MAG TPA: ABC transporter ATP-binding protein [Spirillospora sp.]